MNTNTQTYSLCFRGSYFIYIENWKACIQFINLQIYPVHFASWNIIYLKWTYDLKKIHYIQGARTEKYPYEYEFSGQKRNSLSLVTRVLSWSREIFRPIKRDILFYSNAMKTMLSHTKIIHLYFHPFNNSASDATSSWINWNPKIHESVYISRYVCRILSPFFVSRLIFLFPFVKKANFDHCPEPNIRTTSFLRWIIQSSAGEIA